MPTADEADDSASGVQDQVRHREVDPILLAFVEEANARKSTFVPVTLLVGGLIVTGILVGASEYLRGTSKVFAKGDKPAQEGTWAFWLIDAAKSVESDIDSEKLVEATHVHLKDAQIQSNGQRPVPSDKGIWWRGKITSVDGFWLGKLTTWTDKEG